MWSQALMWQLANKCTTRFLKEKGLVGKQIRIWIWMLLLGNFSRIYRQSVYFTNTSSTALKVRPTRSQFESGPQLLLKEKGLVGKQLLYFSSTAFFFKILIAHLFAGGQIRPCLDFLCCFDYFSYLFAVSVVRAVLGIGTFLLWWLFALFWLLVVILCHQPCYFLAHIERYCQSRSWKNCKLTLQNYALVMFSKSNFLL